MEIPYGKYIDSNINHDLPLSTEIIPYKAIKIDISNDMEAIHSIDHINQHTIVHQSTRDIQIDFVKCKYDPKVIKWVVILSFTISVVFVLITHLFQ
jgi:hypothetical protein